MMANARPVSWAVAAPPSRYAVKEAATALPLMSMAALNQAACDRKVSVGVAGLSSNVDPLAVGTGPTVPLPLSRRVVYRQHPDESRAAHLPPTGSGSAVAASALAIPAGATAAIVPTKAAETAAATSLRTMAHPCVFCYGCFAPEDRCRYRSGQWAVRPYWRSDTPIGTTTAT